MNLETKLRDKLAEVIYKQYDYNEPLTLIVILSYLYKEAIERNISMFTLAEDKFIKEDKIKDNEYFLYMGLNGDKSYLQFQKYEDVEGIKIFKLIK